MKALKREDKLAILKFLEDTLKEVGMSEEFITAKIIELAGLLYKN